MNKVNAYSATWFETFLVSSPPPQTSTELAFLERQLPRSGSTTILDLCCGTGRHAIPLAERGYRVTGRHAIPLAERGYRVTGIDGSEAALAVARERESAHLHFVQLDMRALTRLPESYDAVLCMWQSFGYFDAPTNAAILQSIAEHLNPAGRLILDIYCRPFFEAHQGEQTMVREGRTITERKRVHNGRLLVTLDYGPELAADQFDWQLYSPEEISALAHSTGLRLLLACSGFEESRQPSAQSPRMQLVFEKA